MIRMRKPRYRIRTFSARKTRGRLHVPALDRIDGRYYAISMKLEHLNTVCDVCINNNCESDIDKSDPKIII